MSDSILDAAIGTFVDEAREMLEQMEQSLLKLEDDPNDIEELNALFRSVHTIKGSAGLFGLDAVVRFTHEVESVMDDMRGRKREMTPAVSSALFRARDHIELLLDLSKSGAALDAEGTAVQQDILVQLGATSAEPTAAQIEKSVPEAPTQSREWKILARFKRDAYRNGFDPLAVLTYLESLGEASQISLFLSEAESSDGSAPDLDPESCRLQFSLALLTEAERAVIEDAFRFVLEDCDVLIVPPDATSAEYKAALEQGNWDDLAEHKLGELLVKCGALTERELGIAVSQQEQLAQSNTEAAPKLGELLIQSGAVAPAVVEAAVSQQVKAREKRTEEARFVKISAEKLDQLINLVGELVTAGASTSASAAQRDASRMIESAQQMNVLIEEVRDTALAMRMVPIGETFSRFKRVVRDVCMELGKDVELELTGTDAELDKSMVEKLADPLMHIVRNALDHGIEKPDQRIAAGKPARGTLHLSAYHEAGAVIIRVQDDGRGVSRNRVLEKAIQRGLISSAEGLSDEDVLALLFAPGFSTAEQISNLSGRGVGMDVVKRNIESLRGTVRLSSVEGAGTSVLIKLPLTLAIIDGFLVKVGQTHFILPLDSVVECINGDMLPPGAINAMTTQVMLRGHHLPVVNLRRLFGIEAPARSRASIVIVRDGEGHMGILVDSLLGEHQTVIKPLGRLFEKIRGIAGSSILGTGDVALILETASLAKLAAEDSVLATRLDGQDVCIN